MASVILGTAMVGSAMAQMTDPSMTCADYMKHAAAAGPTPKTGDAAMDKMAADMEKKMKDYCTANPTAKAMDAAASAFAAVIADAVKVVNP